MTRNVHIKKSLPPEIVNAITLLGERLGIARKRRFMTMQEMSSRVFVTRKTLARLEKGDPGVSLALLASVLWTLGLDNDLLKIAVPERDKVGIFNERKRLPLRVRRTGNSSDLNF